MAGINKRLNIVDEVSNGDTTVHVHSTPIRREIWDEHYLVLTKFMSKMYEEGLTPPMGARIALRLLRDIATEMGEATVEKVEKLLLPEIWRLTNVLVPDKERGGWSFLPFEKAIKDGLIDDDDADIVKNHLIFFTAASWVHTPKECREMIYPMMKGAFGSLITSLTFTAYKDSLPTSTLAATTGATATASSMPS